MSLRKIVTSIFAGLMIGTLATACSAPNKPKKSNTILKASTALSEERVSVTEKKPRKKRKSTTGVKKNEGEEFYKPQWRIEIGEDTYFVTDAKTGDLQTVINESGEAVGFLNKKSTIFNLGNTTFYARTPKGSESQVSLIKKDKGDTTPYDKTWPTTSDIGYVKKNDQEIPVDNTGPKVVVPSKAFIERNEFLIKSIDFLVLTFEEEVDVEIDGHSKLREELDVGVIINRSLAKGYNFVRVTATDYLGNKTIKEIRVRRSGQKRTIEGIDFIISSLAFQTFEDDKEHYERLAKHIAAYNKRAKDENKVTEIFVPFFHYEGDIADETQSTRNGWFSPVSGDISLGYLNFRDVKADLELRDIFDHESGHKVYEDMKKKQTDDLKEVAMIYNMERHRVHQKHGVSGKAHRSRFFRTFTDAYYTSDVLGGHPWDKPTELFASAYMIFRNYREQLMIRVERLEGEEKENALKLIEIVRKVPENKDITYKKKADF